MTIANHAARARMTKGRLERAEALVVSDREVMGGEPCLNGTRVPVYQIGALAHAHGVSRFLTEEQIELVPLYVKQHPRKERPRQTRLPKGATIKHGYSRKVRLHSEEAGLWPGHRPDS